MKQLAPDLWQTSANPISERASTHGYLLTRPSGNLLIYGIGSEPREGREADLDEMERLGGVQLQVLSHRDESGPGLNLIRERFGSRLGCSALEEPVVRGDASVDLILGSDCDDPALDGLEILETPGHTAGDISFRYQSPHGQTYLFTGDVVFPNNDDWAVFVFEAAGGNPDSLEQSLRCLRDQDPDLVLSSAHVGDTGVAEVTNDEWTGIIDHRIERLRQWVTA